MQKESVESKPVSEEDKLLSDIVGKVYNEINETLESIALDANNDQLFKVAISDLVDKISIQSGIKNLILDGIITQRLVDGAKQAEIECIIGHRIAKLTNSDGINLKTFTELQIS
jgi:hypothetical protein